MDIALMMLLPFIMFGAFAAIGVAMVVYFEQERGLRFIGYCVAVAFGVAGPGVARRHVLGLEP